jgi:hypothetical protein
MYLIILKWMDRLAVTRFNDQTWKENVMYRNSRQNNGCIYNSPRRISLLIYPDTVIFVIEMNNSLNQIEGIGILIELLEMLLFLGSTHMKRGQGIQEVPDWIKKNKKLDFIKSIKQLFLNKYTEINNN